jgi:putative transposase
MALSACCGLVNLFDVRTVCHTRCMNAAASDTRYKTHRIPAEIISHGVWLYYQFYLSYRDVEELLFVRGIIVSYEAIRKWCRKFGQQYANQLRRRRPGPGDEWHLELPMKEPKGATGLGQRQVTKEPHRAERSIAISSMAYLRPLKFRAQDIPQRGPWSVFTLKRNFTWQIAQGQIARTVEHRLRTGRQGRKAA